MYQVNVHIEPNYNYMAADQNWPKSWFDESSHNIQFLGIKSLPFGKVVVYQQDLLKLCVTIMCRNDELSWLFANS